MAIRFAAASGLALALFVASPAGAQGFFSSYEMSPRQIVGMLSDDGYELRAPMLRRGDVYIADVSSVSGRSARLIVSARDGRVLERYAPAARWRDRRDDGDTTRVARTPRRDYEDDREADDDHRDRFALGDIFNPPSRVYGGDLFSSKPTPPSTVPDAEPAPRPKHHTAKKHKDSNVAKTTPTPEATPAVEAPKPDASSVAAVAPNPAPEPKKPVAEPVKPAAPVDAPKPAAEAPKPTPSPAQTKAEVEKRAVSEPAPAAPAKPSAPRKKLNDLPVGTLD